MAGCIGQDWASYQPNRPNASGLAFAFIKTSEATNYLNPRRASQVATARAAGLVVGHYHFARPGAVSAQVAYFLQHAPIEPGDVLCLDWEDAGVTDAWKDAWLKAVQAARPQHRVILYCNRDFWINRDHTGYSGDDLWIADPNHPTGQPAIKSSWLFHQYSEAGGIDRDYCHLTPAQLRQWADGITPAPLEDDVSAMEVLTYRNPDADAASVKAGHGHIPDFYGYVVQTNAEVKAMHATIAAMVPLIGKNVDTPTVVKAVQDAIAAATVHVSVDVTGDNAA